MVNVGTNQSMNACRERMKEICGLYTVTRQTGHVCQFDTKLKSSATFYSLEIRECFGIEIIFFFSEVLFWKGVIQTIVYRVGKAQGPNV